MKNRIILIAIVVGLSFIKPFVGNAKPTEALPVSLSVKKGDLLEITVTNLEMTVSVAGKRHKTLCQDKPAVNLVFSKAISLSLTCGQAYGGIVRLHYPDDLEPRAGIVVGDDWGDEGCLRTTSSSVSWSKNEKVTVTATTRFSGKHVDGNESDCNPHTEKEIFEYNSSKKTFDKKSPQK